ncbi:MAG: OmpA family protein [Saprospiraceae bacterium]|nr:OmpA family protein [Saprospiraceae bacterium]
MMQNFSVAPLLPGTVIELPNIYYNFNDATLRPDAQKDLDLLVSLMKQQQSITVELASHTDCRGTAKYNEDLSQRRANGVIEYLASKGISRDRMKPVGYGESEPRNHCNDGVPCTEVEYARNRRTEVRILTGIQGASVVYVDGKANYENAEAGNTQPSAAGTSPGAAPKKNVNTAPPAAASVAVAAGDLDQYYVVAGSFAEEARANTHLQAMQAAGYATAQIVRFPNSPYHSVCIDKFATRREAETLKRQLDKDKIEAFVRAMPKTQ